MRGRLIELAEPWLFERAGWALGLAFALRLLLYYFLWGGHALHQGMLVQALLTAPLVALLLLLAVQGLIMLLVPRAFSAAVGLVSGGACYCAAVELLTRFGWPLRWPLGTASPGWLGGALGLLLLAAGLQFWQRQRWLAELRGHGVEWTRLWAWERPFSARRLALRALHYMGDRETV